MTEMQHGRPEPFGGLASKRVGRGGLEPGGPDATSRKPPKPSVYLADGDNLFRGGLAQALRQGGANVVEFASGSELSAHAMGGEPDLILLASDREDMEGCQVYARLKSQRTGKRFPLVLVTDRNRPLEQVVRSVQSFLAGWSRLCVRNLAGVVAFLQTRGASGRFEVEAFGERGTVVLQGGAVLEARWKELRGREVLRFFAEELPEAGFRFAEWLVEEEAVTLLSRGAADIELARVSLERGRLDEALLHLRIAETMGGEAGEVQYLLGLAHLRSGDLAVAVDELRAAQRVLPGEARVVAALREAVEKLAGSRAPAADVAQPPQVPEVRAETPQAREPETRGAEWTEIGVDAMQPLANERPEPTIIRALRFSSSRLPSGAPAGLPSEAGATAASETAETGVPSSALGVADGADVARIGGDVTKLEGEEGEARADEPSPDQVVGRVGDRRRLRMLLGLAAALTFLLSLGAAVAVLLESRRPAALATSQNEKTVASAAARRAASPDDRMPGVPIVTREEREFREAVLGLVQRLAGGVTPQRQDPDAGKVAPPRQDSEVVAPARLRPKKTTARGVASARMQPERASGDSRPRPRHLHSSRGSRAILNVKSGELEIVLAFSDSIGAGADARLSVLVDASGLVTDARVLRSSGYPELDEKATRAIRNLHYAPARRDGETIAEWVDQPVSFTLD